MYWKKPKTFSSKQKKENFIEIEAKRKKDLPAPTAYPFKSETMWTGLYRDCSGHSGRWLKAPKKSYIDDILKMKKLKLPGPCTYKIPKERKRTGLNRHLRKVNLSITAAGSANRHPDSITKLTMIQLDPKLQLLGTIQSWMTTESQ